METIKTYATKRKSVLENANTLAGKELHHRYKKDQFPHERSFNLAKTNLFATHRGLNDATRVVLPSLLFDISSNPSNCQL